MVFRELLDYCRIKALADMLSPDEESVWRDACRTYSKAFHTPLIEVLKMDPEHVLLSNFEDQLEGVKPDENIEQILEEIYTLEDPNYEKEKEEEIQNFIKKVEAGEIAPKRAKKASVKVEEKKEPKQTSGSVDFSHLKNES